MLALEAHFVDVILQLATMRQPVSTREALELINSMVKTQNLSASIVTWKKQNLPGAFASNDSNQQYVDVKYTLCQPFRHPTHNCDRMAIWLILKEASTLVDDKLRTKLLSNYAAADAKRHTRKLSQLRGTVCQLYQTGHFDEGDYLLNSTISNLNESQNDIDLHHSSDSESSQDS
jgi:hypothetical protein